VCVFSFFAIALAQFVGAHGQSLRTFYASDDDGSALAMDVLGATRKPGTGQLAPLYCGGRLASS
jgi:hypothetical protein